VRHDIHLPRSGVCHNRMHKRAQQWNRRSRAVSNARLVARIGYEIALVSLVAQTPQLAGIVSVIEKKLGKIVDIPERIAGGRKGSVVIPMQKDDGNTIEAVSVAARSESENRNAEIRVEDYREIWRQGGPKHRRRRLRMRLVRPRPRIREYRRIPSEQEHDSYREQCDPLHRNSLPLLERCEMAEIFV